MADCQRQIVSIKTDVSARYEHVNSFQLGLNLMNWGSSECIRTEAVAVAQDGHTPLFGSDLNSVELFTFWFCLECHTTVSQHSGAETKKNYQQYGEKKKELM